jgi:hypothetical protein
MKQTLVDAAGSGGYFQIVPGTLMEGKTSERGFPMTRGILQRKEALNQNRRRYPGDILEREVEKYQELIKNRNALGELDHPDSSVISLQNVSHNIVETHWEGNDLVGTVEVLCDRPGPDGHTVKGTPAGNTLKALLDAGIRVGISSRGMGSVKEIVDESDGQPAVVVQDDFELLGWDFVSNPSTHEAWQPLVKEGLIKESKQMITEANKFSKVNSLITEIICDVNGVCCCLLEGKNNGEND